MPTYLSGWTHIDGALLCFAAISKLPTKGRWFYTTNLGSISALPRSPPPEAHWNIERHHPSIFAFALGASIQLEVYRIASFCAHNSPMVAMSGTHQHSFAKLEPRLRNKYDGF